MFIVIDCGSVSTRLYLVKGEQVIAKEAVSVGANAACGKEVLKQGIATAVSALLARLKISLQDVRFAIASGMITSNLGLLEVPHLIAPVGLNELVANLQVSKDPEVFPLDLPMVFVPGIKNRVTARRWEHMREIDLMRGEETQALGLVACLKPSLPVTILELGSTTKLIHIDAEGRIAGSLTSMSGQVYSAVKKETFIGSSMAEQSGGDSFFSESIVERAHDCLKHAGMLRALIFTRFIQFGLDTTDVERRFYCQSVLAADDLHIFEEARAQGFDVSGELLIVGEESRARLYKHVVEKYAGLNVLVRCVTEKADIEILGVVGAMRIAKQIQEGV